MKSNQSVSALVLGTLLLAFAGSSMAASDDNNPLNPSYYANRSHATALVGAGDASSEVSVDRSNPLRPSHYAERSEANAFVGTAASSGVPYMDAGNPLHPAHKFV